MRCAAVAALLAFGGSVGGQDTGFELLYTSATEEFVNKCVTTPKTYPEYATGSFVLSSTGIFEYNGKRFQGVLDSFGKMHRFDIKGDQVCATYTLVRSGFYNKSVETDEISHGTLFYETVPPRSKCPQDDPLCNLKQTNDNCYANSMWIGGELYTVTDALMMLKLDPSTLAVKDSIRYDTLKGMSPPLSTAHPMRDQNTGNVISFREQLNLTDMKHDVVVYSISGKPEKAANRKDVGHTLMGKTPYMHSFGLTKNYAVLPRMPLAVEMKNMNMLTSQMFVDLEVTSDRDINNAFHVVPLDGSPAFVRYLPMSQKLYYVHTVNAYETETGIIIDLTCFPRNPFNTAQNNLTVMRTKSLRDQSTRNPVTRFFLPFNETQPVTSENITIETMQTDYPLINPNFQSRKHCYFWSNSWFTTSPHFGDMGVVKYDVCSGSKVPKVWSRPNWFPSEPRMLPSGDVEDEGVLLFTALNGETGETFIMNVNATNMETISETGPFPRIGFTAHGEFFPAGTFN